MVADRRLPQNGTWLELIRAYVGQLRKTAAGRGEEVSELARQKTLLIKAQTEAQDLKNSVARGEYAPIGILADVLALASSAIVDRLDQLEGQLRKACPDLPEDARQVVLRVIADARNEWIRSTSKLVADSVERMAQSEEDEHDALDISEDAV
jgi:phage terminase Nu1 subunit (DNA packaging protein)